MAQRRPAPGRSGSGGRRGLEQLLPGLADPQERLHKAAQLPVSAMREVTERIEDLDVSLFAKIGSETSTEDRRSLLAVQRATTRRNESYAYLEVGSHLGGSIQPHLIDFRCRRIYSIDPRPFQQPDDRKEVGVCNYENNSTDRMLGMLRQLAPTEVSKITCFDMDASDVDPSQITDKPQITLIDGEHTHKAVLSDFHFCNRVSSEHGTIIFHDFGIIFPAILDICSALDNQHRQYVPLKLEGSVFAIFFDPETVRSDPYLASLQTLHQNLSRYHPFIHRFKRLLPAPVWTTLKHYYNMLIWCRIRRVVTPPANRRIT